MKTIITIIKKDIIFSLKWIVGYLVCAIGLPVYFMTSKEQLITSPLLILGISILAAVMFSVSRICYLEDDVETKNFLKAAPVSNAQYISARYLLTFLLILFANATGIVVLYYFGFSSFIESSVIAMSISMFLYAIFLMCFYCFGYIVAQYSFIAFFLLSAILEKLDFVNISLFFEHKAILCIWSIIIYLLTYYVSCLTVKIHFKKQ